MRRAFFGLFVLAAAGLGCGGGSSDGSAAQDDSGAGGDSTVDSSSSDTGGRPDGVVGDTASGDTGKIGDTAIGDTGSADTATTDSAATDSGAVTDVGDTAAPVDTAVDDTGAPDTGTPDTGTPDTAPDTATAGALKTVFIIMMENHDWSAVKGSSSAPYVNGLLSAAGGAAWAENYKTPAGNHPSEPNYIWLEAGDNLGITDDNPPSANHKAVTDHLVTLLEAKGVSWRSYQEDMVAGTCPLTDGASDGYATKHNPMVFFDDVTDGNSATSAHCIAHMAPFTQLATDLGAASTTAQYNFISPNLCHDSHGSGFGGACSNTPFLGPDLVKLGDDWLAATVPTITDSAAFKAGGVLFIVWDEGSSAGGFGTSSDGPIGMVVLSPLAKPGYSNTLAYTHSSTLKTVSEIFGVTPLRDAASASTLDLSDLFTTFP